MVLRKKAPKIQIPALENRSPRALTDSGSWVQGQFRINKKGARLVNNNTKNSSKLPKNIDEETPLGESSEGGNQYQLKDMEVLGVLGRGSAGLVKKVRHVPSGRILAMKQIPATEDASKTLMAEIRSLKDIHHDNFVRFYGAFYEDNHVQMLLEYCDVGSLLDVVKKSSSQRIPDNVLAHITKGVLVGLEYLHTVRHIIHRDIKPSNILINSAGEVKISDFGVASDIMNSLEKAASWVGTVCYMSPERITGQEHGFSSDIWSVGLSVLELATGKYPYLTEDEQQEIPGFWDLMNYIVEGKAPTPGDDVSKELGEFVSVCLRKEGSERATASGLLEEPFIKNCDGQDSKDTIVEWLGPIYSHAIHDESDIEG